MAKTEIVATYMVFRQFNKFIQTVYKICTDYHLQLIYRLYTDYTQVSMYRDCILTICRLPTNYIQALWSIEESIVLALKTIYFWFWWKKNRFYLYRIEYRSQNGCR